MRQASSKQAKQLGVYNPMLLNALPKALSKQLELRLNYGAEPTWPKTGLIAGSVFLTCLLANQMFLSSDRRIHAVVFVALLSVDSVSAWVAFQSGLVDYDPAGVSADYTAADYAFNMIAINSMACMLISSIVKQRALLSPCAMKSVGDASFIPWLTKQLQLPLKFLVGVAAFLSARQVMMYPRWHGVSSLDREVITAMLVSCAYSGGMALVQSGFNHLNRGQRSGRSEEAYLVQSDLLRYAALCVDIKDVSNYNSQYETAILVACTTAMIFLAGCGGDYCWTSSARRSDDEASSSLLESKGEGYQSAGSSETSVVIHQKSCGSSVG